MNTKRQAKAGGEVGANGSFYSGGKFINTVPENRKGDGGAHGAVPSRPMPEWMRLRTLDCIARHEATLASGQINGEWLSEEEIRGITAELNHYRRQVTA